VIARGYLVARSVLRKAGMTRAGLVLFVIAAASQAASAGGYIGLGVGTSPSGEIANDTSSTTTDGSRSWTGIVGYRFGHLSLEGTGTEYTQVYDQAVRDATQWGIALKYSLPLGNGFEAFGRGGLQRTDLSNDWSGDGWMLGAGFEWRFHILLTGASAFVEYNHADTTFEPPGRSATFDGTASMWTLGVTLAL
jgi:hypothetical protein